MNISRISGIYNNSYSKPLMCLNNRGLNKDIFVKTTKPSFKGSNTEDEYSFNSFLNWVNSSNYLEKAKKGDYKGICLGSGFEGVVYEIPNCDNWVIKEFRRSAFIQRKLSQPDIIEISDDFPEMNVGQTIAKIEMPCGSNFASVFYIRKRQQGVSLGVDTNDYFYKNKYNIKSHADSLRILAGAPQSTYDKLIKDINFIHDKGFEIDCSNPNNFMYDSKTHSINFVDINDKYQKENNQLGEVLYALLDTQFASVLTPEDTDEKIQQENRKNTAAIAEKFFNAMANNGVQFENGEYFNTLLNTDLLDDVLNSSSYQTRINALCERNLGVLK